MKIIRQDPSEIIHFQYDMSIFPSRNLFLKLLGEIRRQTSKKIVITLHSIYIDPPFIEMINDCLMFTDAYIVHQENAKNFLNSKGMDPSKIFVISHGSAIIKPASYKMLFFKKNVFKIVFFKILYCWVLG